MLVLLLCRLADGIALWVTQLTVSSIPVLADVEVLAFTDIVMMTLLVALSRQ